MYVNRYPYSKYAKSCRLADKLNMEFALDGHDSALTGCVWQVYDKACDVNVIVTCTEPDPSCVRVRYQIISFPFLSKLK